MHEFSGAEERTLLAELPGLGTVSRCPCNTIHLSVGSVTVRLAPEAFVQMMCMCREAMEVLATEAQVSAVFASASKSTH